ncbi:MAG: glutaredoxin [Coxiella sp. DG_40]|nr:MAG: glutaredoxin [Coxiella sp. DG_40]
MVVEHVSGRNAGQVMLYALSTCVWCKKTRQLLDDLGVEYNYEYVDLLQGEEREGAIETVKRWNPRCTFPTLVINNECVVGFDEGKIRELLK